MTADPPHANCRAVPLTVGMAEIAAALHADCGFYESWSAESFSAILAAPQTTGLIAVAGDDPVGLIVWRVAADESEILTVCVLPERRRQSYARFLMDTALTVLKETKTRRLFLEVAVDNIAAIALYETVGFHEVGRRPRYYRTPKDVSDALTLMKEL